MSWLHETLTVRAACNSNGANLRTGRMAEVYRTTCNSRGGQMKLVRFEDINGRETFVNLDRVNHVSDYGSGTTEINFGDKEASVMVAMEVSAVAARLLKADKS
jgi:hypothetical protein